MTPQPLNDHPNHHRKKLPLHPQISLRALVVVFLVMFVISIYHFGL